MARPVKMRKVCPGIRGYAFRCGASSAAVELQTDEVEALRLCDLEEISQDEAAASMAVSRGTLQRLLYSARRKVAFALVCGRGINTDSSGCSRGCPGGRCRYCTEIEPSNQGDKTMKIAVTCENDQVFQHFGRTPCFAIFTVDDGRITARTNLDSNGVGHGALAGLLRDNGVDLLIAGGIGAGAQMALAEAGIRLVGGASGDVEEAVRSFLDGTLAAEADFLCRHHKHEEGHACGEHGCGGGCHR